MVALLPRTLLGRTVLVLIITVALTELATQLVFRQLIIEQYSRSLLRLGGNDMVGIAVALRNLPPDRRMAYASTLTPATGLRVFPAANSDGPSLHGSHELPDRLQRLQERLVERLGPGSEVLLESHRDPPHVWVRLPVPDGDWWVEFERTPFDRAFPLTAVLVLGGSLCLAVAVAWFTVQRINQPLRAVQRNILALSVGAELPHPERVHGPAEITDLASAVERTHKALRQAERERALLLAGVSHDLRTPLARVRLAIEMMEHSSSEDQMAMVQDLEEIDRIIDQFLDFARSPETGMAVPGDLGDVARECGNRAAQHIDGLVMEIEQDLPIAVRRPALDRLIGNLLENARRYAKAPIVLRAARQGNRAVLSVLDRGPGIPPDQAERLLQPFTRLDASRTGPGGAGLGLAIVDRIAQVHGARLELLPRDGGGLEARVSLPLLTDPALA